MKRNALYWFLLLLIVLYYPLPGDDLPGCKGSFIKIEPVQYYFHTGSYRARFPLTSSTAKIWYVIQRADEGWKDKPLFVFFNGGPGGGTSSGLLSFNTAKKTINSLADPIPDEFVKNSNSWSKMGNLLYIDARQTGFSFCEIPRGVEDINNRLREFNAQNFNVYFDAADFIRVILAIFEQYPDLKNNRVILVGESYGGVRASMMLYMLLNYPQLNETQLPYFHYQDPDLAEKLDAHFTSLYPDINKNTPYDWVKLQFSHQILIQPAIDYTNRSDIEGELLVAEGSPIYDLAEEVGIPFNPVSPDQSGISYKNQVYNYVADVAKRDIYFYAKPDEWTLNVFGKAGALLGQIDHLKYFLAQDISLIGHLYAENRTKAYRVIDTTSYPPIPDNVPQGEVFLLKKWMNFNKNRISAISDLHTLFGDLETWDRFHIDLHLNVNLVFYYNAAHYRSFNATPRTAYTGYKFLRNLQFVKTFITNAKYDIVVYTKAISEIFKRGHTYAVTDVVLEDDENEERPGYMLFKFTDGWGRSSDIKEARIRFPVYLNSGHAVSLTEPSELLTDVRKWLADILEEEDNGENND